MGVHPAGRVCEKITGARLTAIASRIVSGETWLKSTSIPRRFISPTRQPNGTGRRAWVVGRGVGPFGGLIVGQRHVARAEVVNWRSAARLPPIWRPPSMPISEATRPALWMRTMSAAVCAQLEVARVGGDQAVDDVDLLDRLADRLVAGDVPRM